MAKKSRNNTQKNQNNDIRITIIVITFAVLLVAAIATLVLVSASRQGAKPDETTKLTQTPTELTQAPTEQPTEPEEAYVFPFEIPGFTRNEDIPEVIVNEQLSVLAVGSYSGPYFEDSSDDTVTDVLAILVENVREDWVENADLTLSCGEETAQFTVSALPGHRCAILLEQNRMTYSGGAELGKPVCTFCTNDMTGMIEDFSEDFSLEPYEGDILVLRNVSGHEIAGDAVLYYKTVAPYGRNGELLFLGGIAYSNRFEGPFAVDEMRQASPSHYTIGGSAILFMSYDS